MASTYESRDDLVAAVEQVGPWFHQIDLPFDVRTRDIAPTPGGQPRDHPQWRWDLVAPHLPEDMTGMRVLDIGCADGYFSIEVARRGATVLAMDLNRDRVERVAFAADVLGLDGIEARRGSIDDIDDSFGEFDLVLFLALLYHLKDVYGGLARLVPLAPRMILESAAIDDPRPCMYFDPPAPSHPGNPKWFPTTGCVNQMLDTAGYQHHELLAMTGSAGEPIGTLGADDTPGQDLSTAPRIRALWAAERD
jgi:tRNA (mo5U34)-methyltransferase